MNELAIHINKIKKSHNSHLVLDGVNVEVRGGESVGLVGVNGAGKTTLLKCILDLNRVDFGEISIFGRPSTTPKARSELAYLPERFTAPAHLNGLDYLNFVLKLHGKTVGYDAIEAALQVLDLSNSVLKKPVASFSKGMMQKLGLIACFLTKKQLFILDEPMSGLDPLARTCLKNYLQSLKADGHTLFVSTHMLSDVASICDRMLVLHHHTIQFDGSPAEFAEKFGQDDLDRSFVQCISKGR